MASDIFRRKSIDQLCSEASDNVHGLKRALGPINLVTLGIGAIIGTGIFVLTGAAAAANAGPAVVLSFVLAGIASALAGLCYAEFASMIPIAGSAYTYGYATLGEFFAWIIGWDLILEYAFGAATVAVGWSGYVNSFLQDRGIVIPPSLTAAPGTKLALFNGRWDPVASITPILLKQGLTPAQVAAKVAGMQQVTAVFNIIAFLAILVVSAILVYGIKESAGLNTIIVIVKVGVLLTFIGIAVKFILAHWSTATDNWTPFIPPNSGNFGEFGWSGIARGAAVIFFAYIGFDAVSTAAQEAKRPQRDMPIGILGSLAICTVLYILVSGLLTGVMPYTALNVPDPVARGVDATGVRWGSAMVKLGAVMGLSSTMIVMLLGQSRVFFSMSRDGLLPTWAGKVHERFRTPYISTILVGLFVSMFAGLVPVGTLGHLVSIGTLLAFVIVCTGVVVLRYQNPHAPRPFKTPWVPFVPVAGALVAGGMMASLPLDTWVRLIVWLVIGLLIYFGYSRKHSLLSVPEAKNVSAD